VYGLKSKLDEAARRVYGRGIEFKM